MNNKNLLRRVEDKTKVAEKMPQRASKKILSPALQEGVDKIIQREK